MSSLTRLQKAMVLSVISMLLGIGTSFADSYMTNQVFTDAAEVPKYVRSLAYLTTGGFGGWVYYIMYSQLFGFINPALRINPFRFEGIGLRFHKSASFNGILAATSTAVTLYLYSITDVGSATMLKGAATVLFAMLYDIFARKVLKFREEISVLTAATAGVVLSAYVPGGVGSTTGIVVILMLIAGLADGYGGQHDKLAASVMNSRMYTIWRHFYLALSGMVGAIVALSLTGHLREYLTVIGYVLRYPPFYMVLAVVMFFAYTSAVLSNKVKVDLHVPSTYMMINTFRVPLSFFLALAVNALLPGVFYGEMSESGLGIFLKITGMALIFYAVQARYRTMKSHEERIEADIVASQA